MHKIDSELPTEVLVALAKACGFSLAYERSSGADEWTLSHGHGVSHVQHVGTRKDVCAFLIGYADMQLTTTQILNDVESAHRKLIADMRDRLGPR
jgi:hypothetical protein